MEVVFSNISGLSILAIDDELAFVDDELNIYDRFSVESFGITPQETLRRFIIATKNYFKDCVFKQFEYLSYRVFAKSEFVKRLIEEIKGEENEKV